MMSWEDVAKVLLLLLATFGGMFALVRYVTGAIKFGIDKEFIIIAEQFKKVSEEISELRSQMKQNHRTLVDHLTRVEAKLDAHISDYSIHNTPAD